MRLVLADDHRMLLDALATALTQRGHVVAAAVSSRGAVVDAVRRTAPDICLLDIRFPDGDGLETARELKASGMVTKVVILSATTDAGTVAAAAEAGVVGFTHKDQTIDAIVAVLERVHSGETVIEADLAAAGSRSRPNGESDLVRMMRYLTERELEVLWRLVEGETTEAIARGLGITVNTARTHVQNVLVKLGAHTRLQAAALVVNAGLVRPPQARSLRRTS